MTTKTITIYGASDDLVEVDGSVPGADERGVGRDNTSHIVVHSVGGVTPDVFRVAYGKRKGPTWTVEHVTRTGALTVKIAPCDHEADEPDPYTDTATVSGPIVEVEVWGSWPPTPVERREAWDTMAERLNATERDVAYAAVTAHRRSRR